MKISKVIIYDINLGKDFHSQWNPIIIKIETDEGIYGLGEVGLAYGNASKAAFGILRDFSSAYLIGFDPNQIELMWDKLFRRTFWGQGGGPVIFGGISAIDEALWDIKGKMLGVPVYELLGGKVRDKIRVYANDWYSGLVHPEEYAEAASKVKADGFNALKFDPFATSESKEWDYPPRNIDSQRAKLAVERVKAVRNAVGDDVDILIEVHGNLGTTAAIQIGKQLEEFKPFFYEEPVDALNVDCMKKVSENVNIPIAAGERLYTRYGFRQYIEKQAVDILQPDINLAGGLSEAKKIASYAETYNLHVQPHNCGSPVATAVSVNFDACTTNFIIQEWFPYWHRKDDRLNIVKESFEPCAKDSYFSIPNKPGLGVELNDSFVQKFDCVEIS
jgi:galactonate dehydratase